MKVIVAATAASGAIYTRLLLQSLVESPQVEQVALIFSSHAQDVVRWERVELPESDKISVLDNSDLFSSPASGSANWDAMVVCPCTVGTAGRIASGVSSNLIERAADVMLKERRPLILVIRETPLSLIHLRNLTTLTEAGAIILPAAPSFYSQPQTIEELCSTVTSRVCSLLAVPTPHYQWGADNPIEKV